MHLMMLYRVQSIDLLGEALVTVDSRLYFGAMLDIKTMRHRKRERWQVIRCRQGFLFQEKLQDMMSFASESLFAPFVTSSLVHRSSLRFDSVDPRIFMM